MSNNHIKIIMKMTFIENSEKS